MLLTVLAACGAMLVNDVLATLLTLAQSSRKHKIAGHLDGLGDYSRILLYSGAGTALVHGNGWKGYLGMIPVAVTGDLTTRLSTKHGDRLMEIVAADGFQGLLAWRPGIRTWLRVHLGSNPPGAVVEKPEG